MAGSLKNLVKWIRLSWKKIEAKINLLFAVCDIIKYIK
jgi:hypothetical protein